MQSFSPFKALPHIDFNESTGHAHFAHHTHRCLVHDQGDDESKENGHGGSEIHKQLKPVKDRQRIAFIVLKLYKWVINMLLEF